MGFPVTALPPTRSSGETRGVWDVGVNGSSLGTTEGVRKAGNLQAWWEEKRHSDLQAPGVAHLMPSRQCWDLSAAQSTHCHSSVCSQHWWEPETEEGAGAVCRYHSLIPVLSSFWEERVAFHRVHHKPLLKHPCIEGSLRWARLQQFPEL